MFQPLQIATSDHPQVLTIGLFDCSEASQSIRYDCTAAGNMPFGPLTDSLGLESINDGHPHANGVPILVESHCGYKGSLARCTSASLATTPFTAPLHIIELNDAADGMFVIGLFHRL